jgi:hypothetical protein
MKKAKLFLLISAVLVITLLSVGGAWAGPAGQTTPSTTGGATGGGGTAFTGESFVNLITENPAPPGMEAVCAFQQASAGTVCFTVPWDKVGDWQGPTIRRLDNGSWVTETTYLGGIAADGSGLEYCADVEGGTFACTVQ